MSRDPRIDAYIERQAEFARPILARLRAAVHAACPECEEAVKWGMPAFLYKGSILCHMAAFKAHAAFGFWRGAEVTGGTGRVREAMGSFGRLAALDDLPDEATLASLIRKAVALADSGAKRKPPAKHSRPPLELPPDLADALAGNVSAKAHWEAFPPGCRRDYAEWIVAAKRPETRARRVAQATEWIGEGKRRNWKYEKCRGAAAEGAEPAIARLLPQP